MPDAAPCHHLSLSFVAIVLGISSPTSPFRQPVAKRKPSTKPTLPPFPIGNTVLATVQLHSSRTSVRSLVTIRNINITAPYRLRASSVTISAACHRLQAATSLAFPDLQGNIPLKVSLARNERFRPVQQLSGSVIVSLPITKGTVRQPSRTHRNNLVLRSEVHRDQTLKN